MITIIALAFEALLFGAFVLITIMVLIKPEKSIDKPDRFSRLNWIVPAVVGMMWMFIHLMNG